MQGNSCLRVREPKVLTPPWASSWLSSPREPLPGTSMCLLLVTLWLTYFSIFWTFNYSTIQANFFLHVFTFFFYRNHPWSLVQYEGLPAISLLNSCTDVILGAVGHRSSPFLHQHRGAKSGGSGWWTYPTIPSPPRKGPVGGGRGGCWVLGTYDWVCRSI